MGKSPPDIIQLTETVSPLLIDSSPNVKGVILGGTNGIKMERKSNM